ncbi:MAG: inositol oxygenase [Planctomycetaceae bacterium]|nr:MAG: inositol oxygenase [Planctomycetaceae bacterium]
MPHANSQPLPHVDDWEASLQERYPAPSKHEQADRAASVLADSSKPADQFRNYAAPPRDSVREFYRLNHQHQTLDFVLRKKAEYLPPRRREMGIWEAMEFLNTLVDDSDPDADFSQIEHLLQNAEAIRRDGHPRWFILTGLIHDLGKILCLFGEPQWAVVGDTFPVGCAFSDKIVFPEFFAENPDSRVPEYQTRYGIYEAGCGLDKVHLSWGHDEYLYQVVKDYLPEPALAMIRYHSFYPGHREGAYDHLMSDRDRELIAWVRAFNPYDLYSKGAARPDVAALKPFYEQLIAEFFPARIAW